VRRLTVLYDAACPLCVRCCSWLRGQPTFVEIELLGCESPEARRRYGQLPRRGQELIVVSDDGRVWTGPAAFIVCLWALREWRDWSYRLASPAMMPMAQRFFHALSTGRHRLAAWMGWAACETGACSVDAAPYR
jgi:predicted DCC family thiol-disulfide oxidoreductase YuxK